MKTSTLLEECAFPEVVKELDLSTMRCIKLREGSVYYGQIEEIEIHSENKNFLHSSNINESKNTMTKKVRSGYGVQFNYKQDGNLIAKYEGYWYRGKKHGDAFVLYGDRSTYRGDYKNNVREGFGVYTWPTGYSYQGEWKDDKMDGNGVFKQPNVSKS